MIDRDAKNLIVEALLAQRGDSLEWLRRQFRDVDPREMSRPWGLSGLTRDQVLANAEARDVRYLELIAAVEAMPEPSVAPAEGPPSRTVELHEAFSWACEDCGVDNFARGMTLSPEQVEAKVPPEDRAAHAWAAGAAGAWIETPDVVTCSRCGARFAVEHSS